jgi:molybdopterin-guanine dinucleotide biosynthesis protein A/rhodanese-related sulfurtransferase
MGTDKAFVEVGGIAMAARVAAALEAAGCDPVRLIGGDSVLLERLARPAVPDDFPGQGPGGGVLTALRTAADDHVVVASCDLPALDVATVTALTTALAERSVDVAVAVTDRWQLSLTAWRTAAAPALHEAWAGGARALHELVAAVPHTEVPVASDALRNVNTPAELSAAEGGTRYVGPVAVQEIDVDQLADRLAAGARVVDVREPDEYTDGHVPGAVLVPLASVPDHVDAFTGTGPTYVICRSGGRSMRACEWLDAQGVEGLEVANVAGGTLAWIASGRETVGGDQPS